MSEEKKGGTGPIAEQLKGATRGTIEALAVKMGLNPSERAWVAVDIGASLAGISSRQPSTSLNAHPKSAACSKAATYAPGRSLDAG